jgi:2-methylcitrate synthase/citrate synthase II
MNARVHLLGKRSPVAATSYSPGLEGIVAGETGVSTLDGGLSYRGYAAEELAERSTYEETAYLLLYGELPTADQLQAFRERLAAAQHVPPNVINALRVIPAEAASMDVLRTGASLLAHWDADLSDNSREANLRKTERLIVQLPVIMTARERMIAGKEPLPANPKRSFAANILWMLTGREPSAEFVRALDITLILYAEHEFNASTFTARVIASTLSDLHSAIVGAIGALKGPLHGGANERVIEVLQQVGNPDRAEAWIRDALARKVRIMGFGHRVYKEGDPRAVLLKPICADLARATGNEEMERTADTMERIVWEQKKLPPNTDWPSARLYHYLGLPVRLYTPLFVVSRVAGWAAHVIEQHENNRLIRPSANYTGSAPRTWKPVEQR